MSRRRSSGECTVLCACSICGLAAEYPTEMRYGNDSLLRCFRHNDTETPIDEARARMLRKPTNDESNVPFPVGGVPTWFDT